MKTYTSFLIAFLFIFGVVSFVFEANTVNAYDSGCFNSALYSVTTGQLCSTSPYYSSYTYGCTSAGPYNTITGQPCSSSQYGGVYSGSQYDTYSFLLNAEFKYGERGDGVLALQQELASLGFFSGKMDGIYGPKTERALLNYRAQHSTTYLNSFSYPIYNQAPTISGVSGPQSLALNQQGTWTVSATNLSGENLTYSVNWGDQLVYGYYGSNSSSNVYLSQQNATFTHAYSQSGTYTPVFTVTNSKGQSVQTSVSVSVSGYSNSLIPTIYSINPTYGRVGTQVTIYGTGFNAGSCDTYGGVYNGNICSSYGTNNTINFGSGIIEGVYSYGNGTSLTFTVPSVLNSCYAGQYCTQYVPQVTPGTYPISVKNINGTSNVMNFSVGY